MNIIIRAMKALHFLISVLIAITLFSCANDVPAEEPQEDQNEQEEAEASLTIASKNIKTISPYSFTPQADTTETSPKAKASISQEETYLSYFGPNEVGFQPLVFESTNGTKLVFKDAILSEIGGGYYLCYIQELLQVKEDPRVIYEFTGEDASGNPIYEPVEIKIDVSRYYGENEAIINAKTGETFLTINPQTYSDGVFIEYQDIMPEYRIETPNALYLSGFDYNSHGSKRNMYRIEKDKLSEGLLQPMINGTVLDLVQPIAASDDLALFSVTENGTNNYFTLIRNTNQHADPVRFELEPYEITFTGSTGESKTVTFNGSQSDIILDRDTIRCVASYDGKLFILNYQIVDGEIRQTGYTELEGGIPGVGYPSISLVDILYCDEGQIAYLVMRGGDKSALVRIVFGNGEPEATVVNANYDDVLNTSFTATETRLFWMRGGAYSNDAAICYVDFPSGRIESIPLQGKSAASSKINACEDGTIIFWQNLGGAVGVFSMNVNDPNHEVRLIMRNEVDVKQIINIDSL